MQSYSEKFQKEIIKHLRLVIITILTLALLLVAWLEVSSFQDEKDRKSTRLNSSHA